MRKGKNFVLLKEKKKFNENERHVFLNLFLNREFSMRFLSCVFYELICNIFYMKYFTQNVTKSLKYL